MEALARLAMTEVEKPETGNVLNDDELLKMAVEIETQTQESLTVSEDGVKSADMQKEPPDKSTVDQDLDMVFGPGASC